MTFAFARAFARLRRSFEDSAGTIVFGMEDGTVSIFGLVFGVAGRLDHEREKACPRT